MGKVNFHSTGKVREKTEISYSLRYLTDSEFMRTHEIPNGNILWKAISFPGCGFLRKLEVITKPK